MCDKRLRVPSQVGHITRHASLFSYILTSKFRMARATTTTHSQKVSQSQARPSQSQRAHRSRNQVPEEEENENEGAGEEEYEGDADMHVDDNGEERRGDDETVSVNLCKKSFVLTDFQDILRKANDLVRLALFVEHKRTPLRREDISKKGVLFFYPY